MVTTTQLVVLAAALAACASASCLRGTVGDYGGLFVYPTDDCSGPHAPQYNTDQCNPVEIKQGGDEFHSFDMVIDGKATITAYSDAKCADGQATLEFSPNECVPLASPISLNGKEFKSLKSFIYC